MPRLEAQPFIGFTIIAAFVGCVFMWFFRPPSGDPATLAVLNNLVGLLAGMAALVVNYYYSSSRGSAAKDETIAKLNATPPGGPVMVTPAGAPVEVTSLAAPSVSPAVGSVPTRGG